MTINGRLLDELTGEGIPFANVYISDAHGVTIQPPKGVMSTFEGNFSLNDVYDNDYITASHITYGQTTVNAFEFRKSSNQIISMKPKAYELPMFEVIAKQGTNFKNLALLGFGFLAWYKRDEISKIIKSFTK